METNNENNSEEVTTNSLPFDFDRFDFLEKCLKQTKEEFGLKTNKIKISCFDVNQNLFVFGTNCGLIYCFKRHVFNTQQLFKYRLFSSPINLIKLITDELLSFVTESGIYVWNRLNQKFLYGWKCPTKAFITCLQTFMSINDQKLLLFSGDSEGWVRFHDLINCQQITVFKDFGFQIIQIEFIDSQTVLISTSFKTVIVEINFSDLSHQRIINVGKNERKTYGKYGAVYSHKSGLIYGSRPSLHLIKSEISGNVIETIRINNIKESECPQTLEELIQKPITGKLTYKLGILQLFCNDQFIISTNDSNLLIIGTDGQFCVKEKVDKMVDIKISAANSNEAFLLLESKHIIRIRNNQMNSYSDFDVSSEYEKSTESEYKSSTDSKSSNESLFNLIKGPVIMNPISFIDEELKKVFDFNEIQRKLSKKYNQLSTSIISTIDSKILPNSDKNVFIEPEYHTINDNYTEPNSPSKDSPELMPPLVVTRKGKRKTRYNSSESLMTNSSNTNLVNEEMLSNNNNNQSSDNHLLTNIEITNNDSNIRLETNDSNDDNRLQMILSAYKEANHTITSDTTENQDFLNEDNELLELKGIEINDEINGNHLKSDENIQNNELTECDGNGLQTEQIEGQSNDNSTENEMNFEWELIINLNETKQNLLFCRMCANGYNSNSDVGLIWFLIKDQNCLVYYPSFDSLKLSKGLALDMACATNELYVLNNLGFIYKREGMDATKPVGTKWTQMRSNKNRFQLTSISLNQKESILWCCDSNGETWVHQIKTQKWFSIKDFSSHSMEMKKVCVSIIDSSIVWGLDKNGRVFVRSFLKSGDNPNEICGEEWLLMDGILAIDIVVCCDNSVLIAVRNNQIFRRSAKIEANDKINEWKPVIAPEVSDDDSIVSLSVTENNDIMLMTAKGLIWHTFTKKVIQSTEEDKDWLLI